MNEVDIKTQLDCALQIMTKAQVDNWHTQLEVIQLKCELMDAKRKIQELKGQDNKAPTGFLRLKQVLDVIPVSRATWWRKVQDGTYPAPVKLSDSCTAWRKSEIEALAVSMSKERVSE